MKCKVVFLIFYSFCLTDVPPLWMCLSVRHVYDNVGLKANRHVYENPEELRDETPDLILAVKPKVPLEQEEQVSNAHTILFYSWWEKQTIECTDVMTSEKWSCDHSRHWSNESYSSHVVNVFLHTNTLQEQTVCRFSIWFRIFFKLRIIKFDAVHSEIQFELSCFILYFF